MPEYLSTYYFLYYFLIIVFSGLITLFIIPSILHVARTRHLYDDVGHFRKQHDHGIPRLGGVAIFVSFTLTILLFSMIDKTLPISYLLTAAIILFAMGIKDDLSGVNSSTKFFIQFIVGLILVILGDIRLTSMYGVFNIYDLPYVPSVVLSVLMIMLLINAFNLIDGIDGLAGTTCVVVHATLAVLFILSNHYELAAVSLALVGAVAGFLRFNFTPAKIFMGDTGSLLIGLISAVMAIKFIELNKVTPSSNPAIYSAPALAFAILIGPIFDTLRVFTLRILKGLSPFAADRNHIHHRMLRLGYSHLQTTIILVIINIMAIGVALIFSGLGNFVLIGLIFANSLLFNWIVTFCLRSKERHNLAFKNFFV
ncbi:undecaprenyl/decaprenyl-phosphate alpha-N-acetylglucosaminyl 1-phosphate transferase [Mucilaginibacter pallidiroseus]|uniref:Undecaprenyl/decaprenyl-phosphate alpha-N-acetylglucosaminyl 1-phosphate transferase n=1 Tax=Mucilaginibacter pallidiroseus TaxID=2599295 RepID=A0A563UJH3_9SPHI|nr:MraY family glycosyltransferase [Mucilaginibacter pallidiroseus]TWR31517.1 undecaprenyl/decaprenyl-phosphate alpha-N-acetylglucosaminyl 1-phosphate transferase [Mucilaginibacter pallidiroseus]